MPEIPEGVKKPTDHQRAKAEVEVQPVTAEFEGERYVIDPDVVNDVELLEDLGDLEDSPHLLPRVTRRMLGPEQWGRFKKASRDEHGRIDAAKLSEFFDLLNESLGNR